MAECMKCHTEIFGEIYWRTRWRRRLSFCRSCLGKNADKNYRPKPTKRKFKKIPFYQVCQRVDWVKGKKRLNHLFPIVKFRSSRPTVMLNWDWIMDQVIRNARRDVNAYNNFILQKYEKLYGPWKWGRLQNVGEEFSVEGFPRPTYKRLTALGRFMLHGR